MNVRLSMNPPGTKWLDVVPVTQLYRYVHIYQADKRAAGTAGSDNGSMAALGFLAAMTSVGEQNDLSRFVMVCLSIAAKIRYDAEHRCRVP
jgi:hypothetical protein